MIYNFGGDGEMTNLEVVKLILEKLGKPERLISFVTDRLGHDRRYAIDSSFAHRELNWKLRHTPREGIAGTVEWYLQNQSWWEQLLERAGGIRSVSRIQINCRCLLRSILVNTNILAFASSFEDCEH